MKNLCYTILLCLFMLGLHLHSQAQDGPSEKEMMEAWTKSATPGPEQAWLAHFEGEWNTKTTVTLPGQPVTTSVGTSSIKMILEGRFMRENHTGESFGMPFLGESTMGHNNLDGKYALSWIDNTGTGIMYGTGEREGDLLTINASYPKMIGEGVDHFRLETELINKDKHVMRMFMTLEDGTAHQHMKIEYTRK